MEVKSQEWVQNKINKTPDLKMVIFNCRAGHIYDARTKDVEVWFRNNPQNYMLEIARVLNEDFYGTIKVYKDKGEVVYVTSDPVWKP